MLKWKHPQKSKTSNKRHLPVLVFEIELILSQKQERAMKQQRVFFMPIFIHSHQFWTNGRWLMSRAMKSQKEQRRAMESNEKQQKAMKSNKKQQWTSELEKPKRARKSQDEQRKAHKV